MDIKTYTKLASCTNLKEGSSERARMQESLSNPDVAELMHHTVGMATEVGELLDPLKKHFAYGKEVDWVNLGEELGDLLWYISQASIVIEKHTGHDLSHWLSKNIEKLAARYPKKFSSESALTRVLSVERDILES